MAFIREAAMRSHDMEAGDSFFHKLKHRLPKARRFKGLGKALGRIASVASVAVPGLGAGRLVAAGAGLARRTQRLRRAVHSGLEYAGHVDDSVGSRVQEHVNEVAQQAQDEFDQEQAVYEQLDQEQPEGAEEMDYDREYDEQGDPPSHVRPSHRPVNVHPTPQTHTQTRKTRVTKGRKTTKGGAQGGAKTKAVIDAIGTNLPIFGAGFKEILRPGAGAAGGHRRRQNPANVKALRRSLRRVEGFQKLVKSVERAYPRLARSTHHSHAHGGHKPGCKCVACKHRR
jgi:hypothetical protein